MALNFPQNPVIGQSFQVGEIIYKWNGTSWITAAQTPSTIYSPTVPDVQTSILGDIWVDSNTNALYIFDGTGFIGVTTSSSSDSAVLRNPTASGQATINSYVGATEILKLKVLGTSLAPYVAGHDANDIRRFFIDHTGLGVFSNGIILEDNEGDKIPHLNIISNVTDEHIDSAAINIVPSSQGVFGTLGIRVDMSPQNVIGSVAYKSKANANSGQVHFIAYDEADDIKFKVDGTGYGEFSNSVKAAQAQETYELTTLGQVESLIGSNTSGSRKIFITDITPISGGVVGDKVYSNGELVSAQGDTGNIRVEVHALTGNGGFTPAATIEGVAVNNFTLSNGFWVGTADLSVAVGLVNIEAEHEDGDTTATDYTRGLAPEITFAELDGTVYPGVQTALNQNQTATITVRADQELNQIQIRSNTGIYDAFDAQSFNNPVGSEVSPGVWEYTVTGNVKNNGNSTAQLLGFIVRGRSTLGSYSADYNSVLDGSGVATNEINAIYTDSTLPTASFSNKVYNGGGQQALKGAESATVDVSITGASSVTFSSPNSQLSIADPGLIEPTKTVTRIAGSYNINTANLSVQMNKASNGTSNSASTVIWIADADPVITMSGATARLQSGGTYGTTAQNHAVSINSTQRLTYAYAGAAAGGDKGTLLNGTWQSTSNGTKWNNTLRVNDSDQKGTFAWTSFTCTNLAGKTVNTITNNPNYTLGGFVARSITLGPDATDIGSIAYNPLLSDPVADTFAAALGCNVSDTTKLVATDNNGNPMAYFNDLNDNTDTVSVPNVSSYAIVNDANINTLNTSGDAVRITDLGLKGITTTYITIEIEETP